jgi:hypothetical protein
VSAVHACVWMCGAEYGGGEGDKRRVLRNNALNGPLPAELVSLVSLQQLCVRPTPLPHLAMWSQLPTRWFTGAAGQRRQSCLVGDALTGGAVCTQLHHQQPAAGRTQDSGWWGIVRL